MAQNNKQNTANVKCELYISELLDSHLNDDKWLTSYVKERFEKSKYKEFAITKDLFKEEDLYIYLLINIAKQITPALPCAEKANCFLLANMDIDFEKIDTTVFLKSCKNILNKNILFKDNLNEIVETVCNSGVRCLEPNSHFLLHSTQFVESESARIIRQCYYEIVKSNMSLEDLEHAYRTGYRSFHENETYKDMTDFWKAQETHEEEFLQSFIDWRNDIKCFTNDNIQEDIFTKKYDTVLLYWNVLDSNTKTAMDFSTWFEYLNPTGKFVLVAENLGSKDFNSQRSEFFSKIVGTKCLDAIVGELSLSDRKVFVFKKDKKDDLIHLHYTLGSNQLNEYAPLGTTIYRVINTNDLIALNFDLTKIDVLPTFHAKEREKFYALKDFLKEEMGVSHSDNSGKVFTKTNLAQDAESFIVKPETMQDRAIDDKWKKVCHPVLVIGSLSPIRACYVLASEQSPVYFQHSEMVFTINQDIVDPNYIYYLINSGKIQEIISSNIESINSNIGWCEDHELTRASGFLYIPTQMLAIPSIPLQQVFLKQEREKIEKEAFAKYRQDIRDRKHALAQLMMELNSNWDALLNAKEENGGVLKSDMVYGIKHPHTVEEIVNAIGFYLDEIGTGIENFTPEADPRFAKKEDITLSDYLQDYVSTHLCPEYSFEIEQVKDCDVKVYFSKTALNTIMQNLIFNAWKHGFKDRKEGNIIRFSLSEDDSCVYLSVANNGLPIKEDSPISSEIFKYGTTTARGEDSGNGYNHMGLGCYQIKCLMIDSGRGDVECIMNQTDTFPVTFKLKFNK